MNTSIQFKTSTLPLVITFAFVCFGFLPGTQALSPAPDGGYPGQNTAEGDFALFSLTNGKFNASLGFGALASNMTASDDTANGAFALVKTIGSDNTATGAFALFSNTVGFNNTVIGSQALVSNTDGTDNTAVGFRALLNTTGSSNIGVGSGAGGSLSTGDSDNIDIGNPGVAGDSGTIKIGSLQTATFIAGISGAAVGTDQVFVKTNGQLGTGVPSSARFKTEIKPMDKASEAILALKPVTFRYKRDIDPKATLRFGLVAEEVEKISADLVGRDAKGQVSTVRYEAVNAMLLNEFLKEHKAFVEEQRKVQEQGATIARLQQQIEALGVGLQKVSAQVKASRPAPQMVLNQ
jgi:hypothetical protein